MSQIQERLIQEAVNKLKNRAKRLGQKYVYTVLLMYFAFRKKETPVWAKNIILGALAYFVSPIDSIPDLTPFLGFTDDIGVLSFGLVTIACYIDDDIRDQAVGAMQSFFPSTDEELISEVDQLI